MPVRPPRALAPKPPKDPISAALDQEILAEKAGTYARLMAKLERALGELAAFDRRAPQEAGSSEAATGTRQEAVRGEAATGAQAQEARRSEAPTGTKERARLVARASEALWHVVVQRELMRLPGTERFIREMAVPREVVLGLGVMRARSAPGGPRR